MTGAGKFHKELSALRSAGVNVPMMQDCPQLDRQQELAMLVWRDLCGERQIGMSVGPIPWRAIVQWCDRYMVQDSEYVIELVQAIDAEFLSTDATGKSKTSGHSANA